MMHFPGQFQDEIIERVIRKHPIVYAKILTAFFLIGITPLIVFLLFYFNQYPIHVYLRGALMTGIFTSVYLLYAFLFTLVAMFHEAFDLFIITNQRLIDFTQVNIFKRTVASTPLHQIQDTVGQIDGFVPTLLNYGNIQVKTASGDATEFLMDRIPDPSGAAEYILQRARKTKAHVV